MENRWTLVYDEYKGLQKTALNILSGTVSGYLTYVLPMIKVSELTEEIAKERNLLVVGKVKTNPILSALKEKGLIKVPSQAEGYSIYVGKNPLQEEGQIIAIAGFDAHGVLYGCMDFCNRYCGKKLYQSGCIYGEHFFENRFDEQLVDWQVSTAPKIKTRAIWTWGHVIYDYRQFFMNMARLRFNEVVMWNDVAPLNAKDIVEYAHSMGIKVIWGFAWGWRTNCSKMLEDFNEDTAKEIKETVLNKYEEEYAHIGGDGIYFQSFTEMEQDNIGGKSVAQVVTDLVNDTADALLKKHPQLHIQFGLHATSVKNQLDVIKTVDNRVEIVWEDCGAFPYHYSPDQIYTFNDTIDFTGKILNLRGNEGGFGAVMKGMVNLAWGSFEHFTQPYILGERTNSYLAERQVKKNKLWKIVQAGWLKNAEYVRQMIAYIAKNGKNPILQGLVEDGMFENQIMFPAALFAALLWDPNGRIEDIIEEVSKYPCVGFANV